MKETWMNDESLWSRRQCPGVDWRKPLRYDGQWKYKRWTVEMLPWRRADGDAAVRKDADDTAHGCRCQEETNGCDTDAKRRTTLIRPLATFRPEIDSAVTWRLLWVFTKFCHKDETYFATRRKIWLNWKWHDVMRECQSKAFDGWIPSYGMILRIQARHVKTVEDVWGFSVKQEQNQQFDEAISEFAEFLDWECLSSPTIRRRKDEALKCEHVCNAIGKVRLVYHNWNG